jgi:cysteinyl-tRNA synthetase
MEQASANLEKIERFLESVLGIIKKEKQENSKQDLSQATERWNKFLEDFERSMDDDLNTPKALATFFEMVSTVNAAIDERRFNQEDAQAVWNIWEKINQVFGLRVDSQGEGEVEGEIKKMLQTRESARKNKDFKKADEIREEIIKKGYEIEDTPEGQRVKKRKS